MSHSSFFHRLSEKMRHILWIYFLYPKTNWHPLQHLLLEIEAFVILTTSNNYFVSPLCPADTSELAVASLLGHGVTSFVEPWCLGNGVDLRLLKQKDWINNVIKVLFKNYHPDLNIWSETYDILLSKFLFQGWMFSYLCCYKCRWDFEWGLLTSGTEPRSCSFTLALCVGHFEKHWQLL